MYKNDEVLSFGVDFEKNRVKFLKELANFSKAPLGLTMPNADKDMALQKFFNSRTIAPQRDDYKKILEATNCKDGFSLSFKGHGLSLSNHYWYKKEGENLKYEDISFFINKWDDTFGRAVLNKDYELLKTCDLNVPDIVTPGWGIKGWVLEDVPRLYKLGIYSEHVDESICEVLACKLAKRLFGSDEVVERELVKVKDTYASTSPLITGINEELIPLSTVLPHGWYVFYREKDSNKKREFFEKLKTFDLIPNINQFFIKVMALRSLAFVSDLHFENISVIRNMETGELRMAPLYDLGGAFGSSKTGKSMISNLTKATFLLIYFTFNTLEPDWDYSWYDPARLVGFENEIRKYLSKSYFYTTELIERVIEVYHQQKSTLDEYAAKK